MKDWKKRMWPRDAGGSFKLDGGTGPLTGMCNCVDFMEVYKVDTTFRIKSPESIDPERTNPHAPWVNSIEEGVGSAHHAVARVLMQGRQLLDGGIFNPAPDKDAVVRLLHAIKEELVACDKVATRVRNIVESIAAQIQSQAPASPPRMLSPFPQIADLDGEATAFLIRAKRAVRLMCSLPSKFIDVPDKDSNFEFLGATVKAKLGVDSPVTQLIENHADAVKHLIELRNFQEHPSSTKSTVVNNFRVLPDGRIGLPEWYVTDSQARLIHEDMNGAVAFLIVTAELLLAYLVQHVIDPKWPLVIVQIPEEQQDAAAPVRLRVSMDMSRVRPPGGSS
jgi:hypothetical protein